MSTQNGFKIDQLELGSVGRRTLKFSPITGAKPSMEVYGFANRVGAAINRVNSIIEAEETLQFQDKEYIEFIADAEAAAKLGVEHGTGDLEQGEVAIASIERRIVERYGPMLREQHFEKLKHSSLFFFVFAVVLVFLGELLSDVIWHGAAPRPYLQAYGFAIVGMVLSNWLRRYYSQEQLTWQTFKYYEQSNYPPNLQHLALAILLIPLFVMVQVDIIQLSVGDLTIGDTDTPFLSGFVLGLVCGFFEKTMAKKTMDHLYPD